MAVYAAHLTRTRGAAPSVFQLSAEQALADSLKPALRRLTQYLAGDETKEHWTERWFDEIYLLFDTVLQYHYLKHYAASFSESFYGLTRAPTGGGSGEWGSARLPPRDELASLLLLVGTPYLRDRLYQHQGAWSGALSALTCVYRAWRVLQLGAYLCGATASATPALRALRLALHHGWRELPAGQGGFPRVGSLLLRGAQYGAFALQLLRWWHGARPAARPLPPPAPPQRDARCLQHQNRCPLCRSPWRAPTALTVSGYVFCYTCIARALRASPRCPVTHCPAREHQLVRLYVHT